MKKKIIRIQNRTATMGRRQTRLVIDGRLRQ